MGTRVIANSRVFLNGEELTDLADWSFNADERLFEAAYYDGGECEFWEPGMEEPEMRKTTRRMYFFEATIERRDKAWYVSAPPFGVPA